MVKCGKLCCVPVYFRIDNSKGEVAVLDDVVEVGDELLNKGLEGVILLEASTMILSVYLA